MKMSVWDGKPTVEDPQTQTEYSIKRNGGDCHWTFLMLSMGLFLCITTSLIMITEISSFSLTYQNRNLLIAIYDDKFNASATTNSSEETTTSTQVNSTTTISTPVAVSEITKGFTGDVTETTEKVPSSSHSDISSSSRPETSITEDIVTTTERDYELPSSTTDQKRNPILILEGMHNFPKTYMCSQSCFEPSIYTARLNASLSASTINGNFIVLTVEVAAKKKTIAKRKVAYRTLEILYEDYVELSLLDSEWSTEIPSCLLPGNNTWDNCR